MARIQIEASRDQYGGSFVAILEACIYALDIEEECTRWSLLPMQVPMCLFSMEHCRVQK